MDALRYREVDATDARYHQHTPRTINGVDDQRSLRLDPRRATTAPAPTVLHVEDDEYFASVLATLISRNPDFSYAGHARSAAEALAMCRETEPAIVLLDLWLPDAGGLPLIDTLAALPRPPQILLLTVRQDDVTLHRAWFDRRKVCGLVWKTSRCHEHLPAALPAVSRGKRYFPLEVVQAIQNFRTADHAFHKLLTPHQQRFMDGFALGESDKQIAATLGIIVEGVRTQKKRIMR